MPTWNQSHLSIFPEGQWVAIDESGRLVGSASSLIIDWDDYAESANWSVLEFIRAAVFRGQPHFFCFVYSS
jgi:hypothetical protein